MLASQLALAVQITSIYKYDFLDVLGSPVRLADVR